MTPPGQPVISYAYTAARQLEKETQGSQAASFGYDADGRLADQAMPDGITAVYSYDAAAQLTEIDYWEGAATLAGNITYSYDANGRGRDT